MPPGALEPLIERLEHAAAQLRGGELSGERAATVVDECARLAAEASAQQVEAKRQAWEDLQLVMKELGLKLPAKKT